MLISWFSEVNFKHAWVGLGWVGLSSNSKYNYSIAQLRCLLELQAAMKIEVLKQELKICMERSWLDCCWRDPFLMKLPELIPIHGVSSS